MDVDTASYSVTRRFLQDGFMPDRDSVRLEEFVNSFDYGYAGPSESAIAVQVDGGPTPLHLCSFGNAAYRDPGARDS